MGGNGKNKRNGFAVVLLVLALVSNWLIFEPRYPIPAEYQTYDDLKDLEIIYEDSEYYMIEDGEKVKVSGPDFLMPYVEGDEVLYENN